MPYHSLADFLEELGQAGELARVEAEVSPLLEAAEITRRIARGDGPAVLFARVLKHDIPLLTNLLGSEARICRALGTGSLGEAAERVARLLTATEAEGWLQRLRGASPAGILAGLAPRRVKSAACQQIVRLGSDVDLGQLPLVQSAAEESHRAITAAAVFTAEPDTHRQAAGRYDLALLGRDRLAVCWAAHDEPARLLPQYGRRGGKMPLAAVLGGDPAVLMAASALVPPEVDPLALAGLLREKPLDAVACRSVDLLVPGDADIVIEGYVDPAEPPVAAGPFGTPVSHCAAARPLAVMHVTALTHRANPIFPAMIPGPPPNEACLVDWALARILSPLVKLAIPELVAYDLPLSGAARHWAVLAIRKTYAGQARRVAATAWGLRQFMFAKLLVVVDESVDPRDTPAVLRAIAAHVCPGRDTFTAEGPPDPLDPAATPGTLGRKMALDATAKLPEERGGPAPAAVVASDEVRQLVSGRWPEYGLGPEP